MLCTRLAVIFIVMERILTPLSGASDQEILAKISWSDAPDNGVKIRSITIKITASLVQSIGNLDDVALKQSACIRIGKHNRGNIITQLALKGDKVNTTIIIGQ